MATSHEQRIDFMAGLRAALAAEVDSVLLTKDQVQMVLDATQEAAETISLKELDLVNSGMVKIDEGAIKAKVSEQLLEAGWTPPDQAKAMHEALTLAAQTFRRYETLHRDKGTEDGEAKARANADLAAKMEAAFADYQEVPDEMYTIEAFTRSEFRAYDYAVKSHIAATMAILNGEDDGKGESNEPWASCRKVLLKTYNTAIEASAARMRLRLAAEELVRAIASSESCGHRFDAEIARLEPHLQQNEFPRLDQGVSIRFFVYDPDEKQCGFAMAGSTSTSDARHELDVMMAALEFERAVRLRNVPITPEVLWRHTIGRRGG